MQYGLPLIRGLLPDIRQFKKFTQEEKNRYIDNFIINLMGQNVHISDSIKSKMGSGLRGLKELTQKEQNTYLDELYRWIAFVMNGANLKDTSLRNARLDLSTLVGVNLEGSNLFTAKLNGADLTLANLKHAVLYKSDFTDAQLRYADLRGADLRGVLGLTKAQINSAFIDSKTLLPSTFQENSEPVTLIE